MDHFGSLLCVASISILVRCCLGAVNYNYSIDNFQIFITNSSDSFELEVLYEENKPAVFAISHKFYGSSSLPFIQIGFASLSETPVRSGNYQQFMKGETYHYQSQSISIDAIYQDSNTQNVYISGSLQIESKPDIPYYFVIRPPSPNYPFYDEADRAVQSTKSLDFNLSIDSVNNTVPINRMFLRYDTVDETEAFMGFGQQYSFINLRGRIVPICISEQGVGRGLEPLTAILNAIGDGGGGHWYTSYGSKPLYFTTYDRSLLLYNSEIVVFDLTNKNYVEIGVYTNDTSMISGRLIYGANPIQIISEISLVTGRQKPLPPWMLEGGILGIEGGQDFVFDTVSAMQSATNSLPALIGLWIQDWVGTYTFPTSGTRLLWNWELNTKAYPTWNQTFQNLSDSYSIKIKLFTSIFSQKLFKRQQSHPINTSKCIASAFTVIE